MAGFSRQCRQVQWSMRLTENFLSCQTNGLDKGGFPTEIETKIHKLITYSLVIFIVEK